LRFCFVALALTAGFSSVSAAAQSVDAAVEVVTGFQLVGVTEVYLTDAIVGTDLQTWAVVGGCSNAPTARVRFVFDRISLSAKTRVRIVSPTTFNVDRRVCITNPEKLDPELRSRLKLSN